MAEKSIFTYSAEPFEVDFTACMTIPALGGAVLNTAGADAHGKGFGVEVLNERNCSWVLARMALELEGRPKQYTDYSIATWISDYGRVLSTRNFTLFDALGVEFGRAVTQWAMIDLTARTAVDLSGVGDQHADAVLDLAPPTERPRKVPVFEVERTIGHSVAYSDIDLNRHMNTMRYIDLLFDQMPLDLVTSQRSMRLDIHFLRECRHGQQLTVGVTQRDDLYLFSIHNESEEAVRATVEWR